MTPREFSIRTYVETPTPDEIVAAAAAGRAPGDPGTPIAAARDHFHFVLMQQGYSLDIGSVAEVHRQPIVVSEDGSDFEPAGPDDTPTGDLVTWSAKGYPREESDANVPVLVAARQPDDSATVSVPKGHRSVRVRHNFGCEVTVHAFDPDGQPTGYLFASGVDDDVLHVELAGATGSLRITRDA